MLLEQINTFRAEVEADLGHRIAQCEDAVENLLVTKSSLAKVKIAMLKDLKTTMLKDLKVGIDKRFKSMMKKKKAKPDDSNDENVEPAPPKKCAKASDVSLSIMSLPPEETTTVSVTSDFCRIQHILRKYLVSDIYFL